jgi:hypothetical protein
MIKIKRTILLKNKKMINNWKIIKNLLSKYLIMYKIIKMMIWQINKMSRKNYKFILNKKMIKNIIQLFKKQILN